MEELRSTAIIDSEILEDSRKKAERILQNSKNECEDILKSVEGKVAEVTKEKTSLYEEKIAAYKRDLLASLPLEQKRYLVEYQEKQLQQAIVEYLDSLSKDKKLTIVKNIVAKYKEYINNSNITVLVAGFDKKDIEKLLKAELKSTILEIKDMDSVMASSYATNYGKVEGMIIQTEDKSRLFRVFIGELIEQILDDKCYELASTLFCGSLPE